MSATTVPDVSIDSSTPLSRSTAVTRHAVRRATSAISTSKAPLILDLEPRDVVRALALTAGVLVALHLLGLFCVYGLGQERLLTFVYLFDVDREKNVPTLFSTLLWLLNAVLFAAIWHAKTDLDPRRRAWLGMAMLSCFLGVDEFSELHERFSPFVNRVIGDVGLNHLITWTFVYGTGVAIVTLLLGRWLLSLDRATRVRLLISGAVFVTGAIGFELISGAYEKHIAFQQDLIYSLLAGVEESLEMAGLILCARALMLVLVAHGGMRLTLSADSRS